MKDSRPTRWSTAAGIMTTTQKCRVEFKLTEFDEQKVIEWDFHVTKNDFSYDMIIGRDLLEPLGIDIKYSTRTMEWDGTAVPMKPQEASRRDSYHVNDSKSVDDATERIKKILDAKYEPADLNKVMQSDSCSHLGEEQKRPLLALLRKYESLFDGTLGMWRNEQYHIDLKPGVEPYHARSFPIPQVHEKTLRMEVDRLCEVGVLKKVNRSQWAAPTFIIPKKDGSVRFISDFRELNKRIYRKPYPIPKIQDLMMKLEGFQYGTSLDLNMGYYHIELSPTSKQLCTIVLPWGKYEYQRLPMGLCNSPDIFQEKISTLMAGLEFVRAYIDDVLCITKGSWEDHLEKLEEVLKRISRAGLKVNAKKSFFGKGELEYLGYWITREGIMPVAKKVEAIRNIDTPKTVKDVRRFVGMVNYYRDMWVRRSDVLSPLTKLCSKKAKFVWKEEQQKAFDTMKKILSRETLLAYPNFNKPFVIHTDASHTQLGAVISQDNRPIAFYSRKLNDAQTRYTTTERELLAIVETLKEYRNILLGHPIIVHTDHQNLTYKNFNTERVMRWRLIIEEFGPELRYIKGEHNVIADALSRLGIKDTDTTNDKPEDLQWLAECYGSDTKDIPSEFFPLRFKDIQREQLKDEDLTAKLRENDKYKTHSYRGGGKTRTLIVKDDKIVIPKTLQQRVIQWYHDQLCHPGVTRTENTIRQHFTWKNLSQHVKDFCKQCPICQKCKKTHKHYGLLPEKEAEAIPWEQLCVDLIGPYKLKRNRGKELTLWCVTMIDPATGWFEMKQLPDKEAITVANVVEQTWLTRYPWPQLITYDKGTEFMREFATMVTEDYGITKQGASKRNPQANAIIERIHQTIGNMIRTFQVQDNYLDEDNPWDGILAATMFATRATYHTTLQATPAQLVFGRDAILNTKFEANWNLIRERKQKLIRENNRRENAKRIRHTYKVDDKVLLKREDKAKYRQNPWEGPYKVVKVNNNGSVRIRKGAVTDTFNIRQLKPYFE